MRRKPPYSRFLFLQFAASNRLKASCVQNMVD
jgi:hypothetical protein